MFWFLFWDFLSLLLLIPNYKFPTCKIWTLNPIHQVAHHPIGIKSIKYLTTWSSSFPTVNTKLAFQVYKCYSLLLHLLVCKWSFLQHPIQSEVLLIRSCFETQFHNINKPPLITSYTIGRSLELLQTCQLKLFSSQLWCLTSLPLQT